MVGLDVYWLRVDCSVIGYGNVAARYRLGYSGLVWRMSVCGVGIGSTMRTWLIMRNNCSHFFFLLLCDIDGTRLYSPVSSL